MSSDVSSGPGGAQVKAKRRRSLRPMMVILALVVMAVVGVPVALYWRYEVSRRRLRRRWKNAAVERIAKLSEDAAWTREQLLAAEKGQGGPWGEPEHAWLRQDILVMANGDWIVYRYAGDMALPDRNRIGDLFIGRASDGNWYYSTWHFCGGCLILKWNGQPYSLDDFAWVCFAVEFDGKPDAVLGKTWPRRREAEAARTRPAHQRARVRQTVTPSPSSLPKTLALDCGGGLAMELVLVQAGEFVMGEGDDSHRVRITKPFYVGKHEVTQAQYKRVMGWSPSRSRGGDNPVDGVTWEDATEFCSGLSERTGTTVRLPTEAEWEYACRAGTTTRFCFGDSEDGLGDYAWHSGNSGQKTHPVGGKRANAWGLHDMHGNVWEWCADWYGAYPLGMAIDPTGPASGHYRVLRGGCWSYDAQRCRSVSRDWPAPGAPLDYVGFRVVAAAPGR